MTPSARYCRKKYQIHLFITFKMTIKYTKNCCSLSRTDATAQLKSQSHLSIIGNRRKISKHYLINNKAWASITFTLRTLSNTYLCHCVVFKPLRLLLSLYFVLFLSEERKISWKLKVNLWDQVLLVWR